MYIVSVVNLSIFLLMKKSTVVMLIQIQNSFDFLQVKRSSNFHSGGGWYNSTSPGWQSRDVR